MGTTGQFALACLVALAFGGAHLASRDADRLPLEGDSAKYHAIAASVERLFQHPDLAGRLLTGRLSSAERQDLGLDRWEFQHAAGYLVLLGAVYALAPDNEAGGRLFSLLLYALSAGLLLVVTRTLAGRWAAWVGVGAYLAYLPLLYFGLGIATEPFGSALVLADAWLLLRLHRRPRRRRALLAGLALGLTFLAKTTFRPVVLIVLLAGALPWVRQRRQLVVPWALGALVPVLLWMGVSGLGGFPLNPLATTGEDALWAYRGNYVPDQGWENVGLGGAIGPELMAASDAAQAYSPLVFEDFAQKREVYARGLGVTIRGAPGAWLALVAKKFGLFWTWPSKKTVLDTWCGAWAIPRGIHLWLWPLGLLGWALHVRRRRAGWLPGLLALGIAAVHAGSHLVARYHVPVLPLWIAYALLGVRFLGGAAWRVVCRAPAAERWALLAWVAGAGLALLLGRSALDPPFVLGRAAGRASYVAGVVLSAGAGALLARAVWRAGGAGRRRAVGCGLAILLWVLPTAGERLAERDWDAFAVSLKRPGEVLTQRIGIPEVPGLRGGQVPGAWLEIDMLRSRRGSFTLEVTVQDSLVATLRDTLGGCYGAFLFDAEAHAAQGRYRRVAETYARFLRDGLDRWDGTRSIGYDYFRRWVRVPIAPAQLAADTLVVALRLRAARGGGAVRVFGDRYFEKRGTFWAPAIGENPFEHSNYRAEFFAGDRERMDARLIRPIELWSPWSASVRGAGHGGGQDLDPGWRVRHGELRVRLRVRIPGQLVGREEDDRQVPIWTTEPRAGDEPFGPQQIRRFQRWRDQFFDGTRVL